MLDDLKLLLSTGELLEKVVFLSRLTQHSFGMFVDQEIFFIFFVIHDLFSAKFIWRFTKIVK